MGKFLDSTGISSILSRIKSWVRSLIYKETLTITDNNYHKYMKYNGLVDSMERLCHDEGRVNNYYASEYELDDYSNYKTIEDDLVRSQEQYNAKVLVTSFINPFDGKKYSICDMSNLTFPVGTRNIIFATDTVNLHRVKFVPEGITEDSIRSIEAWKKFNGYKLNIFELPSKGNNISNFPYWDTYDSISDENEKNRISNCTYANDWINNRNNKFGYSTCNRMITLNSDTFGTADRTGTLLSSSERGEICSGNLDKTDIIFRDTTNYNSSLKYSNSEKTSDTFIITRGKESGDFSDWFKNYNNLIYNYDLTMDSVAEEDLGFGCMSPLSYNYYRTRSKNWNISSTVLRPGVWIELVLFNGYWMCLTK